MPKKKGNHKLNPKAKRLTPEEQHARFVEAAKRAEADETPDAMEKAFKRLDPRKKAPSDASR